MRVFQVPMTRVERLGLIAGLIVAAVLMWPARRHVLDGTFVHLQYARHLAAGEGIVFNPGERVYGSLTPLWIAVVADGMMLGLDGLTAARLLGALATLASVALFFQLMRRTLSTPALRAIATVAWAGHAWMLDWSVSGMETPLAVALTLAGFVAFTEGKQWGARPVRTGALWGLASLARPEAVFLMVIWSALLIVDAHNRAGIQRMIFGLLPSWAIYGSWLMFARLYYGTFWPLALSPRVVGGGEAGSPPGSLWSQIRIVGATDGVLLAVLALALLFARARLWPRPMMAQSLLPWLWVVGLPALYASRGVEVSSRHLLIVLPVLGWLAWRAAERWWLSPAPGAPRSGRVVRWGWVVALLVLAQNLAVYRVAVAQARASAAALDGSLAEWGKWFGRHAPEDAVIAAPEIGAIGYFSRRRMLDLRGSITPEMASVLAEEPMASAVSQFRFAEFGRPEFIVDRARYRSDLKRRSRYGDCLVPLGAATAPDLDGGGAANQVYTFYRVDWSAYERITAVR